MCLRKGIGFLLNPKKAFDAEKNTTLNTSYKYLFGLSIISAVIMGIIFPNSSFFTQTGLWEHTALQMVITMVLVYFNLAIATIIGGLWLHVWVYIFGGRGWRNTMKAAVYGNTPNYFLMWTSGLIQFTSYIVIVFYIIEIWRIVLTWMGLNRLVGLTRVRAALAVIIAFLIPTLIMLALTAYAIGLVNSGFIPVPGG